MASWVTHLQHAQLPNMDSIAAQMYSRLQSSTHLLSWPSSDVHINASLRARRIKILHGLLCGGLLLPVEVIYRRLGCRGFCWSGASRGSRGIRRHTLVLEGSPDTRRFIMYNLHGQACRPCLNDSMQPSRPRRDCQGVAAVRVSSHLLQQEGTRGMPM